MTSMPLVPQYPHYLIIGSGLTGATIARILHERGEKVLVLERREHVGGNVHDQVHASGIRYHTYGPHYFRTNSPKIWAFVKRFSAFRSFRASLKSWVDGRYENWPIASDYLNRTIGPDWQPAFQGQAANFEEAALGLMPQLVYEKFIYGYNYKQWGVAPRSLGADLIKRFEVRTNNEPELSLHRFQGLPEGGYAAWMQKMLEGIPVLCGVDYLQNRSDFSAHKKVIFTGPIDEYFGFDLGRLQYRSQRREHTYLPTTDWIQPVVQVNNPSLDAGPHIRTLEWKHLLLPEEAEKMPGTLLTREFPYSPSEPSEYEYPFPNAANQALYQQYQARAKAIPNLLICGRLGEYRYYDMDQAIGRVMVLAGRV